MAKQTPLYVEVERIHYPVYFVRRRYGRQMYTWAQTLIDGKRLDLGDPYPAITWPKAELQRALAETVSPAAGS